jgi:hypothetical protein
VRVKPARLRKKLAQWNVPTSYVDGWASPGIDPYKGTSDFCGVLLHHTAGTNSLNYIVNTNPYAPVRACHFLVARDGTVHVVSGVGAYHAGAGGPWRFPKRGGDVIVPKDQGNRYLYGIEIESLGTKAAIDGSREGMSVQQVVSTALLSAALLDAMRPSWRVWPVSRVIRHRDWTSRKIDVQQDLNWWHRAIGLARSNRRNPVRARQLIEQFVKEYPKGRL